MFTRIFLLLFIPLNICGQSSTDIFGKWVTIDDKTGKERSLVEIFEKDGEAFGKIIQFIENPHLEETERCTECNEDDDRYNQLVLGMEFIRNMKLDGNRWEDGTILDPEEGKVYDCKIWVEDGNLMVRGFIAFFYRTQVWKKFEE